jgi:hypothetical protein
MLVTALKQFQLQCSMHAVVILQLLQQWPIINEAVKRVKKSETDQLAKAAKKSNKSSRTTKVCTVARACIVVATQPTEGLLQQPDAVLTTTTSTTVGGSNSSNSSDSSSSSSSSSSSTGGGSTSSHSNGSSSGGDCSSTSNSSGSSSSINSELVALQGLQQRDTYSHLTLRLPTVKAEVRPCIYRRHEVYTCD